MELHYESMTNSLFEDDRCEVISAQSTGMPHLVDHPGQALGGLMMNHESQEVCYIDQSSGENSGVYNHVDSGMGHHRMAMMQTNQGHQQIPCIDQQAYSLEQHDNNDYGRCSKVTNLQEAFFKPTNTDRQGEQQMLETSSQEDSVEDANFSLLRADNIVETLSQLSPSNKVQDMAYVDDPADYQEEIGFDEPITTTGSLELPKFDPKRNYFESYWRLYLQNEQLLN